MCTSLGKISRRGDNLLRWCWGRTQGGVLDETLAAVVGPNSVHSGRTWEVCLLRRNNPILGSAQVDFTNICICFFRLRASSQNGPISGANLRGFHPSRPLLDPRLVFARHVGYLSSENESGVQQRPGRVKAPQITIWLPQVEILSLEMYFNNSDICRRAKSL